MSSLITTTAPLSVDWQSGLEDAWSNVASFVPKLLVFLVILLVGWIIAKALAKAVGLVLGRVGFEGLLHKAGAGEALGATGIQPITLITKLVYYFVLLIALQLALSAFGPSNPVSQIVNDIVAWLPKAIVAIVIVVIAGAVANAVKDLLRSALGSLSYGDLLARIAGAFIVALGVIAALNQVGIGTTVTEPVLIAVLATVGGILVVGVGGGLIGPMRSRWERWLDDLAPRNSTTTGAHAPGAAAGGPADGPSYGGVPPQPNA